MTSRLLKDSYTFFLIITSLCIVLAILFSVITESEKYMNLPISVIIILFIIGSLLMLTILVGFGNILLSFRNKWQILVLLILGTVLIRVAWVLLINTPVVSDFEFYYSYAKNTAAGVYKDYHNTCLIFPHRIGFPMLLSIIFKIFGSSILVAKIFNVVCSALLVVLVYIISEKLFSKKAAIYSGLLMVFWPAQIMYTSVVASEHLFMVFILAFIWWMIKGFTTSTYSKQILFFSLGGTALAIAQYLRPIALVIAIAIVMTAFIVYGFKQWKHLLLSFIATIIGFNLFFIPMTMVTEQLTDLNLRDTSSGYSLLVGMNQESSGQYNKTDEAILSEYDLEMEAVHDAAFQRAIGRVVENPTGTFLLAFKKYAIMWGGDIYGYQWSINDLEGDNILSNFMLKHPMIFRLISHLYYQFILLVSLIGVISLRKRKPDISLVFVQLLFLSQVGLHLLIEVQSRYHVFGVVMLMLIAGYGFKGLQNKVKIYSFLDSEVLKKLYNYMIFLLFGVMAIVSLLLISIGIQHAIKLKDPLLIEDDELLETRTYSFRYTEASLAVYMPNDQGVYRIIFEPCGINNIYAISDIYFNHYDILNDERYIVGTDFLSPYIVKAELGDDMMAEIHFTGGWHDSIGDGTGAPTGMTNTVEVTIDQEAPVQGSGLFDQIRIIVTNEIEGYNHSKSVLKEVVTYTIDESIIEVTINTTALVDAEITRYYGLQTQNDIWNDTVTYVYDDGSEDTYDMIQNNFSRMKSENIVDYYVVADNSGNYLMVDLYEIGLGNFEYIPKDSHTAFTMNYPKSYYNIINKKPLLLKSGEGFHIKGYYEFGFKNK